MGDLLLGIDFGTTNIKVVAFDFAGQVVAQSSAPTPSFHPRPDWTEHDPHQLWSAFRSALRQIVNAIGDAGRIEALAVASMGEAGVPIATDGSFLYPIIAWHDPRTIPYAQWWSEHFGDAQLFRITGMSPDYIYSLNKLMWLRDHEPSVFARIHKFLCVEDFAIHQLTGEFATSFSIASRTMGVDLTAKHWSLEVFAAARINPEIMPTLYPSGQVVGQVTAHAAKETGLSPGTKVVTGGHDHTCGALAAGVLRQGMVLDSSGTVEGLWAALERPKLDDRLWPAGYAHEFHVVPDLYILSGSVMTSGALLEWIKEVLGYPKVSALAADAEQSPLGSRGVMVLPHFRGGGTPHNDPQARGAIVGLSAAHGHDDIARAALEGIAFEMRSNFEVLEPILGRQLGPLRGVGGGASNPFWLQMKADITEKHIEVPAVSEATALGAGLLAGIGAGIYASYQEAAAVIPVARAYEPNPQAASQYAELWERVYRKLYPALAKISHATARIAGE